ncbi:MAG: hypothetical protein CMG66_05345 [Candidatus Marinimicrobia bacterium]|nr:hypothetical protein [Candidatus Neomarinimicrobiota bacterium]|tara:strand:+ start:11465 stop:14392 length:2928 start_codon:yes stop_codon:yes gene_type:complete
MLFVFLLPLLIITCSDDPSGFTDELEEAFTEFVLSLNGSSASFLDDSGAIDQTSDAAESFKQGIADNLNNTDDVSGVDKDQIVITDIKPINTRNDGFIISFKFVEIPNSVVTITVDECVAGFIDLIVTAIEEETDLTIADYTVTPIEDVFIENLDEESECPLEIDECGICGGNGKNDAGCCGDAVPDCSGECGGNNMSCNGNCFDDASNNCETYDNPDACELNDACHWNELYDDDGNIIYGYCHFDGPPECVWDCERLCDWIGDDQSDPLESNPLGFCEWVVGTLNGTDDCSNDCIGDDLLDAQEVLYICTICVEDPDSGACEALGSDDDDDCFEWMDFDIADSCYSYTSPDICNSYDECHWEYSDNGDGTGECQIEGPPTCVWDCEGICQWEGTNNDDDPIGFCEWLMDATNNGCTSDCEGDDTLEIEQKTVDCQACLDSGNPESDACYDVFDDDGYMEQWYCEHENGMDWYTSLEECNQECPESCYDDDYDYGDDYEMEQWYCEHENGMDWYTSSEECNQECDIECIFSEYGDAPACLEDCTGFNDWAHVDISDSPDAFCYWLTESFVSSDCTNDCVDDEDADMITAYHNACLACLDTNNGCQDAIDELDHIDDWLADGDCSQFSDPYECNATEGCNYVETFDQNGNAINGWCESDNCWCHGPGHMEEGQEDCDNFDNFNACVDYGCDWWCEEYATDDWCLEWMHDTHIDECYTLTSPEDCDSFDECHWEGDSTAGECRSEGPPSCVWDCPEICDWHESDQDDPIGMCTWLTDIVDNNDCTTDCQGNGLDEVNEYYELCQACLESENPESDECKNVYDDDNDDTTSFTLFPDITIIKMTDEFGHDLGITGDHYAGCWDADLYNINNNRPSTSINWDIEPLTTMLGPIYPNPFNPVTTLPIELSEADTLSVFVIDNNNEKVCDIVNNEYFDMGVHSLVLNMSDCITDRGSNYYRLIVDFGSYECFQNMDYNIPD